MLEGVGTMKASPRRRLTAIPQATAPIDLAPMARRALLTSARTNKLVRFVDARECSSQSTSWAAGW